MEITQEEREEYTTRLLSHIKYVQEAGRRIGVPDEQLKEHDASKFSVQEFQAYARYFFSRKNISPVDSMFVENDFAFAWLHHIHNNPHHWQYWIFPDGFSPRDSSLENGVMEMPKNYALEMVADWMGAGRAYTGSWDMTDWFSKNAGRIRVHSKTAEYLCTVLSREGMSDVIRPDIVWTGAFGKDLK